MKQKAVLRGEKLPGTINNKKWEDKVFFKAEFFDVVGIIALLGED